MMEKNLFLVVLFLLFAIEDQRKHSIPLGWLAAGFLPGIILYLSGGWRVEADMKLAILSGCLFLLICAASRGKMGMADGMAVVLIGFYLGGVRLLQILFLSFFSGGVAALLLLLTGKKKSQEEIPMLPYYFLALLVQLCLSAGEQR